MAEQTRSRASATCEQQLFPAETSHGKGPTPVRGDHLVDRRVSVEWDAIGTGNGRGRLGFRQVYYKGLGISLGLDLPWDFRDSIWPCAIAHINLNLHLGFSP
jgi:hypothetical protein